MTDTRLHPASLNDVNAKVRFSTHCCRAVYHPNIVEWGGMNGLSKRICGALFLNWMALAALAIFTFIGPVRIGASYFPILVLAASFAGFPVLRSNLPAFISVQIATFVTFPIVAYLTAGTIIFSSNI